MKETEMPKHIHADLMMQYANDAMETDEPWKRWQFRIASKEIDLGWTTCDCNPYWDKDTQYRRKPEVIKVGKWEFPKPVSPDSPPPLKTKYFRIISYNGAHFPEERTWNNLEFEHVNLQNNVVHLTKESADQHALVLNAISKGDI
ncbi:MAG: hypothetical protein ACFNT6_01950 [Neisseria sp.]|uniref:hypothetical protein n=1 Tax=Neisseria sp. TaxID=192066 RepID=UPI00361FA203